MSASSRTTHWWFTPTSITRTEEGKDGEENEREIHYMKGHTVFNVEQIEGLPEHHPPCRRHTHKLDPAGRACRRALDSGIERIPKLFSAAIAAATVFSCVGIPDLSILLLGASDCTGALLALLQPMCCRRLWWQ
jgi:hypothetical protein